MINRLTGFQTSPPLSCSAHGGRETDNLGTSFPPNPNPNHNASSFLPPNYRQVRLSSSLMALLHKPHTEDKIHKSPLDFEEEEAGGTSIRYVSLDRVYSAASLCGSSNVMSKKVKARKFLPNHHPRVNNPPSLLYVYSRRPKRPPRPSFHDSLVSRAAEPELAVKSEICEFEEEPMIELNKEKKRRRIGSNELLRLGVDSNILLGFDRPRLRDCRNNTNNSNSKIGNFKRKKRDSLVTNSDKFSALPDTSKRWVRWVSFLM